MMNEPKQKCFEKLDISKMPLLELKKNCSKFYLSYFIFMQLISIQLHHYNLNHSGSISDFSKYFCLDPLYIKK